MNRIGRFWVWLSRIHRCRGFGIQSPTDYQFVCGVVNEHWPYYAYDGMGKGDGSLRRKLGRLCFRLANWRQPASIIDECGMAEYLQAGCHKAVIAATPQRQPVELAVVPPSAGVPGLFSHCDDRSVVVVLDIYRNQDCWQQLVADDRVTISYDLYYCGIVMFDKKRAKQSYVINF